MTNVKLIIVAVVIVAASVFFSYLLIPGVQTITEKTTTEVGGSGADFSTNWYRFGGVLHSANSMSVKTATSTPCRIQAPAATSTLIFGSADFRTTTTTDTYVEIAKTTNASSYATTTSLGIYSITAGGGMTILASSTPTAGTKTTFDPNDWFVVKVAGGTGSGSVSGWARFVPTGTCKAEWIVNVGN